MVEDGDVFLWLVSRPQLFGENGHRKWRFLKTPAFCLHVDGRKRRFSKYDDVIRHILLAQRMLLKACYRIYIILTFSCVWAKTIQIRYVWMFIFLKTEKSPFSKIPGYVWTGPKYNMTQRKSCLTCQRKPFAMLINGLGAVFQENYHGNFAESIICCEPHDLVSHRW